MVQNHRQNGPKLRSGRYLGGSWAAFRRLLAARLLWRLANDDFTRLQGRLGKRLGCVLGRTGGVLGGFRASLGAFWGVLGRLGGVLGFIF